MREVGEREGRGSHGKGDSGHERHKVGLTCWALLDELTTTGG